MPCSVNDAVNVLPCLTCAYLNWWPGEIPADWQVIAEADWLALADPSSAAADPVAFAADVTPDRSAAAIAVAGVRPDGLGHVEVVDHRPGTGWVVGRLVELAGKWSPCAIVVDDTGPAGSLIAPLEAADLEVVKPSTRARAAADSGSMTRWSSGRCAISPAPGSTPRSPGPPNGRSATAGHGLGGG